MAGTINLALPRNMPATLWKGAAVQLLLLCTTLADAETMFESKTIEKVALTTKALGSHGQS